MPQASESGTWDLSHGLGAPRGEGFFLHAMEEGGGQEEQGCDGLRLGELGLQPRHGEKGQTRRTVTTLVQASLFLVCLSSRT